MNILYKTESAVFIYCRFSLFLKDPFFQIFKRSQQLSLFLFGVPCIEKELIFFQNLVFQQYWVLVVSRITLKPVLGEVRIVALSISSREQTQ